MRWFNTEKDLIAFQKGTGKDQSGRTVRNILAADDNFWEETHNYIQWLFPLKTRSGFNLLAPVVRHPERFETPYMVDVYQRFRLFLDNSTWKEFHNHNQLRITRGLRSLRLFGYQELADEFLKWLDSECDSEDLRKVYNTYWAQ